MGEIELLQLVVVPIGLGLLGFIEPCTIGSTMLFVKYLEGAGPRHKLMQTGVFALTRGLLMGLLGVGAVFLGALFVDLQQGVWVVLGSFYLLFGLLFATGHTSLLQRRLGPALAHNAGSRGAFRLGLLFGLNIPACAAPIIFALLGTAAVTGGGSLGVAGGFLSMLLFGLALSLPLVLAVLWRPARGLLDRLTGWSARAPLITGLVFIVLGLWSLYFGLFINLEDWT
ncbi:MAG TPA: hypothetical protein ENI96_07135 [Sedimenticola thiotaurini]|uniref:Cytochrome C biogenesis protein transmembrane domain-containing protein n=1 Tax=Sedimenticola thiotaurini TaxID=1543721 RepID=A0A831RK99_9GAMM|nr:hypothetical protein [Sedimenticola thiotaurini]